MGVAVARIVNKVELAEIIGYSERSITDFQKQGMPIAFETERGKANEYNTADVVRWLIDKHVNGKSESAKERLDRIRADREELAHAGDLKSFVPAEEVEQALVAKVMAARSTLLQRDAVLKSELDALHGIDVDIELLNEHTREALTQLSGDAGDAAGVNRPGV